MPMVGGIYGENGDLLPIATRTRRKGLKLGGTARASGATSLTSTAKAVQWDRSYSSNEIPVQVRYKSILPHRIFSEIGTGASTATARLLNTGAGGSGSTVYTSMASATWSEWENVMANVHNTSNSMVLGYIAGQGRWRYEVATMPKVKP